MGFTLNIQYSVNKGIYTQIESVKTISKCISIREGDRYDLPIKLKIQKQLDHLL